IVDIFIMLGVTWVVWGRKDTLEFFRMFSIYGCIIMAVVFSFMNIYKSWRGVKAGKQFQQLILAWILCIVIFNAMILLLSNRDQLAALWPFALFKSKTFLLWAMLVFIGLFIFRLALKHVLYYLRDKGYNQRSAIIAGTTESGIKLAKHLEDNRWMGINFIGIFDDKFPDEIFKISFPEIANQYLGKIDDCVQYLLSNNIDILFIALPMRAENKINMLLWELGTKGVEVLLLPDLFTFGIQKSRNLDFGEFHLLDINLFPPWKRSFDVCFSLFIILLTLPIWLIIALFIKLEDGGPIFYKHKRIMENGKSFNCLKFRTMHINSDYKLESLLENNEILRIEWEQSYKLKNDPRISKIGKFLRKTSLDELPQFLNSLVGHMSVVGPRPIVSEELDKYYKKTALTYCAMKPGITGPWQTGARNDTNNYEERVEMDRNYVLNCSIWGDIKIIFKTIWRVLFPKGAY
ncbi:MAG: sugar transferase, partial [Proteobacteria bacterium]|nr:sugar transferase [Pseudomonadota bacterium]